MIFGCWFLCVWSGNQRGCSGKLGTFSVPYWFEFAEMLLLAAGCVIVCVSFMIDCEPGYVLMI